MQTKLEQTNRTDSPPRKRRKKDPQQSLSSDHSLISNKSDNLITTTTNQITNSPSTSSSNLDMQHILNSSSNGTMPNFINVNELGQNGTTSISSSTNNNASSAAEHHLNGGGVANILMNGKNDCIESNSNNIGCVEIKSNVDREIIRLIGQHLRGLGLK